MPTKRISEAELAAMEDADVRQYGEVFVTDEEGRGLLLQVYPASVAASDEEPEAVAAAVVDGAEASRLVVVVADPTVDGLRDRIAAAVSARMG